MRLDVSLLAEERFGATSLSAIGKTSPHPDNQQFGQVQEIASDNGTARGCGDPLSCRRPALLNPLSEARR